MLNCAFGTCFNENLALWSEMGFGGASPRSRQSPEMPQVAAASIFLDIFGKDSVLHVLSMALVESLDPGRLREPKGGGLRT